MHYRRLGKTGLKLSEISFGPWINFYDIEDTDTAKACMVQAYACGVNYFDGAEGYGLQIGEAETAMGRIIREQNWPRDSFAVSGKLIPAGHGPERPTMASGLNRKHLVDGCEAALERFGVSYLDLFFCHRPDPETPLEETCEGMHELVCRGKILYWGTSCYSPAELIEIYALCERYGFRKPSVEQSEYNLLHQARVDSALAPLIATHGLGITAFSPLKGGILSGKYLQGIPASGSRLSYAQQAWSKSAFTRSQAQVAAFQGVANKIGLPMSRLALAVALRNPRISTLLTGASRPEQVTENCTAPEDARKLSDEEIRQVKAVFEFATCSP